MIEPLPEGHPHTCDKVRTGGGWSRDNSNPNRCGKPAVVIDRQTCNCGKCDMSCHLCEHHARRSGTEEERREDKAQHLANLIEMFTTSVNAMPAGEEKDRAQKRLDEIRRDGLPEMDTVLVGGGELN